MSFATLVSLFAGIGWGMLLCAEIRAQWRCRVLVVALGMVSADAANAPQDSPAHSQQARKGIDHVLKHDGDVSTGAAEGLDQLSAGAVIPDSRAASVQQRQKKPPGQKSRSGGLVRFAFA